MNYTQKNAHKNTKTFGKPRETHLMLTPTQLAHDLVKYTAKQKALTTLHA